MFNKCFPITRRAIETIEAHDADSKSREAECSDAECIGLKLGPTREVESIVREKTVKHWVMVIWPPRIS